MSKWWVIIIFGFLVSCKNERKKESSFVKYDFILSKNINNNLQYFSTYYDCENNIKIKYFDLNSNFKKTNSSSLIEEKVLLHGDTLICDGYNFTPSINVDECITIKYISESGKNYEETNLCLEEIKTSYKINNITVDTCYVFLTYTSNLAVDSYESKIYFDFSRKMIIKEESVNAKGEVVALVELVRESQVDNIPIVLN